MEPHGCQLGQTSNESHEECNSLKRGAGTWCKALSSVKNMIIIFMAAHSALCQGPPPYRSCCQRIHLRGCSWGQNPLKDPDTRATTNYQQMAWVMEAESERSICRFKAEVLPCWAEQAHTVQGPDGYQGHQPHVLYSWELAFPLNCIEALWDDINLKNLFRGNLTCPFGFISYKTVKTCHHERRGCDGEHQGRKKISFTF